MNASAVLFNVYLDGVCVLWHASARKVSEFTGYSSGHIRKFAKEGKMVGGKYDVKEVRDSPFVGKEYTEKETRDKFGTRNYEEWCVMNRRYGTGRKGKCRKGLGNG